MKAKPVKLIDSQWTEVPVKVDIEPPYEYMPLNKRYIPVQLQGSRSETGNWSWNGDTENPTLNQVC